MVGKTVAKHRTCAQKLTWQVLSSHLKLSSAIFYNKNPSRIMESFIKENPYIDFVRVLGFSDACE